MRRAYSERVERAREHTGRYASNLGDRDGRFTLRTNERVELLVLVTTGCDEVPWEHVSVSSRTRCPTWSEMAWVKSLFWEDDEAVVQIHPPKADYVNYHPFCLHLWRPLAAELPLPPWIAVGPKSARYEIESAKVVFEDGQTLPITGVTEASFTELGGDEFPEGWT